MNLIYLGMLIYQLGNRSLNLILHESLAFFTLGHARELNILTHVEYWCLELYLVKMVVAHYCLYGAPSCFLIVQCLFLK